MRIALFLLRERLKMLPSLIRSADGWDADQATALRLEQEECKRMFGVLHNALMLLNDEVANGTD